MTCLATMMTHRKRQSPQHFWNILESNNFWVAICWTNTKLKLQLSSSDVSDSACMCPKALHPIFRSIQLQKPCAMRLCHPSKSNTSPNKSPFIWFSQPIFNKRNTGEIQNFQFNFRLHRTGITQHFSHAPFECVVYEYRRFGFRSRSGPAVGAHGCSCTICY